MRTRSHLETEERIPVESVEERVHLHLGAASARGQTIPRILLQQRRDQILQPADNKHNSFVSRW